MVREGLEGVNLALGVTDETDGLGVPRLRAAHMKE